MPASHVDHYREHAVDRFRRVLYRQLDPAARTKRGLSALNKAIALGIVGAVILAVVETEPSIANGHDSLFGLLETLFGFVFTIEYVARLWTSAENPKYGGGWRGLGRYARSPAALFDLMAVLVSFATPTGLTPFLLRSVRLLRIFRLAKLSRMTTAMGFLINAIAARREELLFSLFVGVFFLLLSATALYFVEGGVQPDKFGSIPRALWWATATLTTIGYGDVYPITALGKVVAAMCAVAGIGLVAMPTGIMAAAFSDAVQRHSEGRLLVSRRERLASLQTTGAFSDELVQQAARELGSEGAAGYLYNVYSPEAFSDVIRTLDRVQLQDLHDFDLVEQVVVLRRLVGRSKHVLDKLVREATTAKGIQPEHVQSFGATATRIAAIQRGLALRLGSLDLD